MSPHFAFRSLAQVRNVAFGVFLVLSLLELVCAAAVLRDGVLPDLEFSASGAGVWLCGLCRVQNVGGWTTVLGCKAESEMGPEIISGLRALFM